MTISGITFPSGACQKQLLQEIYSEARVEDIPLAGYASGWHLMETLYLKWSSCHTVIPARYNVSIRCQPEAAATGDLQ